MVIYAPEDDARLYPDQPKRRVVSWAIRVEWDNGEEEDLIDVPDDVAGKHTLRRVDPKDVIMESDEEPQDVTFSEAIHVEAKPTHMQHN